LKKYVIIELFTNTARVVKLVDSGDSKSPAARRAGSSPAPGTTDKAARIHSLAAFFMGVLCNFINCFTGLLAVLYWGLLHKIHRSGWQLADFIHVQGQFDESPYER